jgi:hypothetical protein
MEWKQKIKLTENTKDWKASVEYLSEVLKEDTSEPEIWIHLMYLIHYILLEDYPEKHGLKSEILRSDLLGYFNESKVLFAENPEYLFFMGMIGQVAEWYWGEKDITFAKEMLNQSSDIEPNNILYKWAKLNPNENKDLCIEKVSLAKAVLTDSKEKKWLEEKGFQGQYILNIQLRGSAKMNCS